MKEPSPYLLHSLEVSLQKYQARSKTRRKDQKTHIQITKDGRKLIVIEKESKMTFSEEKQS